MPDYTMPQETTTSTGAFSTSTSTAWIHWTEPATQTTSSVTVTWGRWLEQVSFAEDTENQRRIEANRRAIEETEGRKEARKRGRELLMSILSPFQREEYAAKNYVTVMSEDNKRTYRLLSQQSNNILLIEKGHITRSYCAHPNIAVPVEDVLISQILYLRSLETEKELLKTANCHIFPKPLALVSGYNGAR